VSVSLIAVAIIAVFTSVTAPLVLMVITDRQKRQEKAADYAREDVVSKRVQEATTLAATNAAAAATQAQEVALLVAKTAAQAAADARVIQVQQSEQHAAQVEAARLLVIANTAIAQAVQDTSSKLEVVHKLVNSNMSAALQAKLDALETSLAMMREVIDLKRAAGREPTPEALAAIQSTESKIRDTRGMIAQRETATSSEGVKPPEEPA
jgi:inorganic triphosphatase YgiF